MKIFQAILFFFAAAVIAAGCAPYSIQQNNNSAKTEVNIPPALSDPSGSLTVSHKKRPAPMPDPAPAAPKQLQVPPPAIKPYAKEVDPKLSSHKNIQSPVQRHTPAHNKFRRGPLMWRAFTRLPADEQQELLKLQRSDPERYREIMQQKTEELYTKENARKEELNKLTIQFHQTTDITKKNAIKAQLRQKLQEEFKQRLQDTRSDIESYKRRTAHLEKELQKREKNCDAIVNLLLTKHLENASTADKK